VIRPRFPWAADYEKIRPVKISFHLTRLLAVFLIAGLAFAPFAGRANAGMAMGKGATMSATEMVADDMIGMAADMPCCPDKSSAPMDCDQCTLMALCMVQNFDAPSPAGMIEIRPVTMRMLAPGSDPRADGLGEHPPPRPPRSPVRPA
jgi:hypothetical protein